MTTQPDLDKTMQRWIEISARSQEAARAFWQRQLADARGDEFHLVDPVGLSQAFGKLAAQWLSDPAKMIEAQATLMQQSLALWQSTLARLQGEEVPPLVEPERGDRRFKDARWTEDALFDHIKQSYLLTSRWLQCLVHDTDGLDSRTREKVEFFTRQFISATSPSNFALTNPQVLKRVQETGGESLLDGLEHVLDDLEAGRGELKISMTDESAFEVGKNVAVTPGKVVFQNELMQLIQYAPTTDKVHQRPIVFIPPWINKFYVLDLQPKNSFIKYTLDQGHTLFVISWVNPRRELAHKSFADYMHEGPLAALDAIEQATGERDVNVLGFCIGGILTLAMLAWMAARGDRRIKSATLLASMVDFRNVGEVSVFVDEEKLKDIEAYTSEKGYLEGKHMMQMFSMMRENDLIWSFVVNNYLMGREPLPFDLLYWNADSTRLPSEMLTFYLRKFYIENGLKQPGHIVLDKTPIDLGKVKIPVYCLATRDDHIAPWQSCYPATQHLGGTPRFVLGGSGHIAGVINPPASKKYCYWLNDANPADPDEWLAGAEMHQGSWWPDWSTWLGRRAGKKVDARHPGDGKLEVIEDAPGSYVKERPSD